jgi:hypothetical protein
MFQASFTACRRAVLLRLEFDQLLFFLGLERSKQRLALRSPHRLKNQPDKVT